MYGSKLRPITNGNLKYCPGPDHQVYLKFSHLDFLRSHVTQLVECFNCNCLSIVFVYTLEYLINFYASIREGFKKKGGWVAQEWEKLHRKKQKKHAFKINFRQF